MKTLLIAAVILFSSLPSSAACIFGRGAAGQSASYQYAFAYISSVSAAHTGLSRISNLSEVMKPVDDDAAALLAFSQGLKEIELAARDFECAASLMQSQEKFSVGKTKDDQEQSDLARIVASRLRLDYLKLAKESRALATNLVSRMKHSLSDIDFAERMAKTSANLHDIPRTLFTLAPDITLVLIDIKPDSSGRMSRLRINALERNDLIASIENAFDERVSSQTKEERPAMIAAARLLRDWLMTSGHTRAPSPELR